LGQTSWLKGTGVKIALGVIAVGALLGMWWRTRAPQADIGPTESRPTVTAETTVTPQATIAATAPAAVATSAAPIPVVKAAPTPTQAVKSTLSEEIAVIDRARNAVYSKNREAAIRALDEYDRRFPKGSLAPEASTLRARAEALP
jgi:TolA-binding protein